MKRKLVSILTAGMLAAGAAFAGSFTSDFSDPNQLGFTLTSNNATRPDTTIFKPVIVDGHLVLTWNEGSQQGTVVLDALDREGEIETAIESFTVRFKLQIGPGSGTPADGASFAFGPEIVSESNFGEEGAGSGLIVTFDIYDNGQLEAPAIDVKYNGVIVASRKFAIADLVTGAFEDVEIQLRRNGILTVSHKGNLVHQVFLSDFNPTAGRFAIGGRTGGATAAHWLDDLSVTTTTATPVAPTVPIHPRVKRWLRGSRSLSRRYSMEARRCRSSG